MKIIKFIKSSIKRYEDIEGVKVEPIDCFIFELNNNGPLTKLIDLKYYTNNKDLYMMKIQIMLELVYDNEETTIFEILDFINKQIKQGSNSVLRSYINDLIYSFIKHTDEINKDVKRRKIEEYTWKI